MDWLSNIVKPKWSSMSIVIMISDYINLAWYIIFDEGCCIVDERLLFQSTTDVTRFRIAVSQINQLGMRTCGDEGSEVVKAIGDE